eukprot:2248564-Amphidinium_carterae.1
MLARVAGTCDADSHHCADTKRSRCEGGTLTCVRSWQICGSYGSCRDCIMRGLQQQSRRSERSLPGRS